jgi:hypothetical protein
MAIAPAAAPVYRDADHLEQFSGPYTNQRYAIVDGVGLFRWFANDVTAADGSTVIAPSGGAIGRWKLASSWPGAGVSDDAPLPDDEEADAGESDQAARADHVHALTSPPLPTGTVFIRCEPADTTGASFYAKLTAALLVANTIQLGSGTYRLSQQVSLASGKSIVGIGREHTIIEPGSGWAPAVGSADDRTISLFKIEGTVGSAINTTIAAIAQADQRQIQPTSTTGMVDGMWLVLQGTGGSFGTGDVYNNSSAEAVEEICQVSGAPVSGWINLKTPKRTHNRITGTTIKDVSIVEGVRLKGFSLRTAGNHACGITGRYARDCDFEDLAGTGFARGLFDFIGCHAMRVGRIHDGGGNNSLIRAATCQHCHIGDGVWTYDPDAVRCHASGIPRAKLNFTGQCVGNTLNPGVLGRGVLGVRLCGGWGNLIRTFHAVDFDSREAKARDASTNGSRCATGFEGAYAKVSAPEGAEFGHGNTLEGIVCINHRHAETAGAWSTDSGVAVWLHDDYAGSTVGFIQITNKGPGATESINGDSDFGCFGIAIQDWQGSIGPIATAGVSWAFYTQGTFALARCSTLTFDGAAGRSLAQVPIYFNHGTEGQGPTGMRVTINGYSERVRFGPSFADPKQRIDELTVNGEIWTDLIATQLTSATNTGDVVTITSTGTTATTKRRAAPALAATTSPGVCGVGGPLDASTGWGMVANLPGRINTVRIAAAYNAGVTLESDANADAVSPASAFNTYIGRLVHATSGAGLAWVGS